MDIRVISIGALEANSLWGARAPVRTGHATTTLIRSGKRNVLVDPGLPAAAIAARLGERANLRPGQITDVFLTTFKPETVRGIEAFENAEWWVHENEREGVGVPLAQTLKRAMDDGEEELQKALERDVAILRRCKAAPDKLCEQVDLFPMFGVSPGACGLIISEAVHTTVICGDAIPTAEHLEQGQVLKSCWDVAQAKESMMEAVEIADVLILGRDNLVINPTRRPF
ncbi:MAG: MBL fold metallo-hydrolase [Planctomycetota bacterium]|nr:MBL fold metallo-hydrolase [Planctomycetota bacterium]